MFMDMLAKAQLVGGKKRSIDNILKYSDGITKLSLDKGTEGRDSILTEKQKIRDNESTLKRRRSGRIEKIF